MDRRVLDWGLEAAGQSTTKERARRRKEAELVEWGAEDPPGR